MHKSKIFPILLAAGLVVNTLTPAFTSYAINSTGKIESTDGSGNDVIIDADDIKANYAAIRQIKTQLAGLAGKSLEWSDEMATYVIRSYETDENGDIIYDENGNPIVAQEEAIGALGTADPTMVVENRSFSSLYAKGIYESSASAKNPGVQQNGTLVDVLNNGFTQDQMNNQPYYAENDTVGTGSSSRAKQSAEQAGDETTADLSERLHAVPALGIAPTETDPDLDAPVAIPTSEIAAFNGSWSSEVDSKYQLDHEHRDILIGVGDALTLPAGYYDHTVTIGNGVVNRSGETLASSKIGANPIDSATNNMTVFKYAENDDGSYGYYSSINMAGTVPLSEGTTDVMLGLQESFVLPAGYYADTLAISNGVRNNGLMQDYIDENDTNKIPAAYYAESDLTESVKYQQLVGRLKNLFGDAWTGGDTPTLDDIEKSFVDNSSSIAPVTALERGGESTPSQNYTLPEDLSLSPSSTEFNLGINESVVVPGGFHPGDVVIKNGVHNNGTLEDYLDENDTNTIPAAYYTASDLTSSYKYQALMSKLQTLFGDVWTIGETPTLAAVTNLFENNQMAMTRNTSVRGENLSNPSTNKFLTGTSALSGQQSLNLSANNATVFELGVNEQLTIPAGFYAKDVTIKNGVVNRGSGTRIISGQSTLEPGYYEGGTLSTTDPAALVGNMTFYHHVHDTEVTDKTVITNTSARTTDGLADNYESPVQSGCYTKIVYKQHFHKDGDGNVVANTTNRTQGGCFQALRYTAHEHYGNKYSKGGCFTIPVYNVHYHTGSSSSGGGCYGSSHYTTHTHSGSSSSGGGCYTKAVEVTHTHSDSCYSSAVGNFSYSYSYDHDGERPELYSCKCTCTMTCSVCGATFSASETQRDENKTISSGQKSRTLSSATSKFNNHLTNGKCKSKTTCGKQAGTYIDHYETECNNLPLNSGLVYERNCGKTAGVRYASEGIAYYDPSCGNSPLNASPTYDCTCGKTHGVRYEDEGIDYYGLSCGWHQGQVIEAIIEYDPTH